MESDSPVALVNIICSDDEPEVIKIKNINPQHFPDRINVRIGPVDLIMSMDQANKLREELPVLDDDGIEILTGIKLDAQLDLYDLDKRGLGETDIQVMNRITNKLRGI